MALSETPPEVEMRTESRFPFYYGHNSNGVNSPMAHIRHKCPERIPKAIRRTESNDSCRQSNSGKCG